MLSLTVKWAGAEYAIEIEEEKTVLDLKEKIAAETNVLPERQKLLNVKHHGKPPLDDITLSAIGFKPGFKIMMMGSREDCIQLAAAIPENLPEVSNDFDIPDEADVEIKDRKVFLEKVARRVREYQVKLLNEPRPGKKLLVLDIDYTLFDHRSSGETGSELMRPYLHEFLTDCYLVYDIVIWSATSMKWIEEKMKLLRVVSNPNYKILAYMDDLAMITVLTDKYGVVDVKPLGVIWGKYSQYGPHNTVMLDDCRHNFLMNPTSGLKIKAFRDAHFNRSTDKELLYLAKYLTLIAELDSFETLDHTRWRDFLRNAKTGKKRLKMSGAGVGDSNNTDETN